MSKEKIELLVTIERIAPLQIIALKDLEYELDEVVKKQERDRLTREVIKELIKNGEFNWTDASKTEKASYVEKVKTAIEKILLLVDPHQTTTETESLRQRLRRNEAERTRNAGPKKNVEESPETTSFEDEIDSNFFDLTDTISFFDNLPTEAKNILKIIIDFLDQIKKLEKYNNTPSLNHLAVILKTKINGQLDSLLKFIIDKDSIIAKLMDISGVDDAILVNIPKHLDLIVTYIKGSPELQAPKAEKVDNGLSEEQLRIRYGEFSEILTDNLDVMINHVVTNDYEPNNITKWRVAVEDRAESLRNRGKKYDASFASMIETVLGCYALEVFKKGASIDMDHVTVNWDVASQALAKEKPMIAYARFRREPLYKYAEIISLKANEIMSDKDSRWFAAGGNWGTGTELMAEAMNQLMAEETGEFKDFMEELEREYPDEFESLKNFILQIGHYETCLRDYRSKIAIEKLGHERSAVKHKTGITAAGSEQPQTFLSKLSYKDGKNNDKGKYATALSWIELPSDLYIARNPVHQERFDIRYEESEAYLTYLFGQEQAAVAMEDRKWKPLDWQSCFPHMDEALDYATIYWYGKGKSKRRATKEEVLAYTQAENNGSRKPDIHRGDDLNFDHYVQTWGALTTLYDLASSCWATSIEHDLAKLTATEFANRINEEIGKLGTQAAIALAYTMALPDSEIKKGEIFESIRAAIDTYIVYLLSQIETKHGIGASTNSFFNREYNERYHVAVSEMETYIKNNASLHKSYVIPRTCKQNPITGEFDTSTGETIKLSDALISTLHDKSFKRKPQIDLSHARTVYNTGKSKRDGHTNLVLNMTVSELLVAPKWPYIQKSNTSVHEDGK
ncbi:MAG: hypothetical protein GW941_00740 [Candidatus Pacebacteria bacterium]|nr:hypothetical protein [Candidatus Paceibacterota bacterium]